MDKRNIKPNFFIIGAPKCGTTSLAYWLKQHPNVYMSDIKEPHYYSNDINNRQVCDEKEYRMLFYDARPEHKAIGEASVWYLYSEVAVDNILKDVPDARFIVCVRNPVEMTYSLHNQQLKVMNENVADIGVAWNMQDKRSNGKNIPKLCIDGKLLLYGKICKLGQQISRLYEKVAVDKVRVILLDDMKKNPEKVYEDTLSFLGINGGLSIDYAVKNEASSRRLVWISRALKYYSIKRKILGIPRIGSGLMKWINDANVRPKNIEEKSYRINKKLVKYYCGDINELGKILGRDLSYWIK